VWRVTACDKIEGQQSYNVGFARPPASLTGTDATSIVQQVMQECGDFRRRVDVRLDTKVTATLENYLTVGPAYENCYCLLIGVVRRRSV
jgi:hypothetical protein